MMTDLELEGWIVVVRFCGDQGTRYFAIGEILKELKRREELRRAR